MNRIFVTLRYFIFLIIRRMVYSLFWLSRYVVQPNPVVVLCYHSVGTDSWRYTVSLEMLRAQLQLLMRTHTPVSLDQIYAYVRGEITFQSPVFAITFDDGYADVYQTVDLFTEFAVTPTLFVLSSPSRVAQSEIDSQRQFMDVESIRKLHSAGWIIGCHSATHADFYHLSKKDAHDEILDSKNELERQLGFSIDYFAYPKGRYSPEVISTVVESGYRAAFSMDDRIIVPGADCYSIARIGVDHSHTLFEFEATITRFAVYFRSVVKLFSKWVAVGMEKKDLVCINKSRIYEA